MRILLDLDGVLVNFIKGALELHNHSTDTEKLFTGHLGEWWFIKLLGMSAEDFWAPIDRNFWANLEWTYDGRTLLEGLERRFERENIALWTSPCDNDGCFDGKKDWVKKHLPKHYSRTMQVGSCKWLGARPDTILVDDADHNIGPFIAQGGMGCLVPRIWNSKHAYRSLAVINTLEQIDSLLRTK